MHIYDRDGQLHAYHQEQIRKGNIRAACFGLLVCLALLGLAMGTIIVRSIYTGGN